MKRLCVAGLLLSAWFPVGSIAQQPTASTGSSVATAPQPTAFTAADIHLSPEGFSAKYFNVALSSGNRFAAHYARPMELILAAYQVEPDAVTGGPPGLEFDHYDILASTPPGIKIKDTYPMLQALLVDRFKLVAESKMMPLPAFVLKAGTGAVKMKQAVDTSVGSYCRYAGPQPTPGTPLPSAITLNCTNMTMEQFAQQLGWMSGQINHPVVDMTGMKGAWDFDFRYSWQPRMPGAVTVFDAVKQLGLTLEAGIAPRRSVTIVSMADAPTPNVAGIEKLLPPAPLPSFDVATVKPSQFQGKGPEYNSNYVDQVTLIGTTRRLIGWAWDRSEKTIFEAPAYADEKVWEISAKLAAPEKPPLPGERRWLDTDQVRLMMRTLLAERFGLKAREEDRPGNAYTLLPGTPKMKKGDPAVRASCITRVPPGEKNPRDQNPLANLYLRCTNVTMDEFAGMLKTAGYGIIKTPVLNKSGLEGRYDLTLVFTGLKQLEELGLAQGNYTPKPGANAVDQSSAAGAPGGAATGGAGAADGPTGVPILLTDAVAKQIGLKLVMEKRPIPAMVVDHINELPTEN